VVAVDATGVVSFSERHCEHCLHRTSKSGKTTYFHQVLEAKLITASGLAISLATEWIVNPDGEYDKQDCERTALVRLAAQLKQQYPTTDCLTADGLYPSEASSRSAVRMSGLYSHLPRRQPPYRLGGRAGLLPRTRRSASTSGVTTAPRSSIKPSLAQPPRLSRPHPGVAGMCGSRYPSEEGQTTPKSVCPPDQLTVTARTVRTLSRTGGYGGRSKTKASIPKSISATAWSISSPGSWQAAKNYYQCLQIGHLLNQLTILSTTFQVHLQGKTTFDTCGFV